MRPFGHILFRPVAARILETNTMQTNATRPLWALLGIAILSSSVQGAVAEGENLLIIGGLEAEQVGFPEFWSPSSARDVIYCPSGGPEGKKAAIVLKRNAPAAATPAARQQGMTLVAGETYNRCDSPCGCWNVSGSSAATKPPGGC